MSTKTTTTSSGNNATAFQFDPASLNAYHQNLATFLPTLQGFASNPYNNQQFNFESTLGQNNAAKLGQRAMSNITGNANAAGYGGNMPGFLASMQAAAARGTSGMQANAFNQAMLNAGNRQMQSLGMLGSFQPLMTGSTGNYSGNQTQTTGGLGTWLPQLIGAGVGMAANAFLPGAGSVLSAGASKAGLGIGAPSQLNPTLPPPNTLSNFGESPTPLNIGSMFPPAYPSSGAYGY